MLSLALLIAQLANPSHNAPLHGPDPDTWIFVPITRLTTQADAATLGMSAIEARTALMNRVTDRRKACTEEVLGDVTTDLQSPPRRDVIGDKAAIRGTVIDVVPGICLPYKNICASVWIRTQEVIAADDASVAFGAVFAYVLQHGDATIDGTRVCTRSTREPDVVLGDEVVVIGSEPRDGQLRGRIFVVRDKAIDLSIPPGVAQRYTLEELRHLAKDAIAQ